MCNARIFYVCLASDVEVKAITYSRSMKFRSSVAKGEIAIEGGTEVNHERLVDLINLP